MSRREAPQTQTPSDQGLHLVTIDSKGVACAQGQAPGTRQSREDLRRTLDQWKKGVLITLNQLYTSIDKEKSDAHFNPEKNGLLLNKTIQAICEKLGDLSRNIAEAKETDYLPHALEKAARKTPGAEMVKRAHDHAYSILTRQDPPNYKNQSAKGLQESEGPIIVNYPSRTTSDPQLGLAEQYQNMTNYKRGTFIVSECAALDFPKTGYETFKAQVNKILGKDSPYAKFLIRKLGQKCNWQMHFVVLDQDFMRSMIDYERQVAQKRLHAAISTWCALAIEEIQKLEFELFKEGFVYNKITLTKKNPLSGEMTLKPLSRIMMDQLFPDGFVLQKSFNATLAEYHALSQIAETLCSNSPADQAVFLALKEFLTCAVPTQSAGWKTIGKLAAEYFASQQHYAKLSKTSTLILQMLALWFDRTLGSIRLGEIEVPEGVGFPYSKITDEDERIKLEQLYTRAQKTQTTGTAPREHTEPADLLGFARDLVQGAQINSVTAQSSEGMTEWLHKTLKGATDRLAIAAAPAEPEAAAAAERPDGPGVAAPATTAAGNDSSVFGKGDDATGKIEEIPVEEASEPASATATTPT